MIQSWSESAARIGAWVGFNAGCLAARIFPRHWLYRFADTLADIGFYLFRGFRTRSIRNVGFALGEKLTGVQIEEIVRKSLQNFFRDFVEIADRTGHTVRGAALGNSHRGLRKSRRSSVKKTRRYCVKRASRKLFSVQGRDWPLKIILLMSWSTSQEMGGLPDSWTSIG